MMRGCSRCCSFEEICESPSIRESCGGFNIPSGGTSPGLPDARSSLNCRRMALHRRGLLFLSATVALALAIGGCHKEPTPPDTSGVAHTAQASSLKSIAKTATIEPFTFDIALGPNRFQIEGYVVKSPEPGRLPAVLVLNGDEGDAHQCVSKDGDLATILGIQVAC